MIEFCLKLFVFSVDEMMLLNNDLLQTPRNQSLATVDLEMVSIKALYISASARSSPLTTHVATAGLKICLEHSVSLLVWCLARLYSGANKTNRCEGRGCNNATLPTMY